MTIWRCLKLKNNKTIIYNQLSRKEFIHLLASDGFIFRIKYSVDKVLVLPSAFAISSCYNIISDFTSFKVHCLWYVGSYWQTQLTFLQDKMNWLPKKKKKNGCNTNIVASSCCVGVQFISLAPVTSWQQLMRRKLIIMYILKLLLYIQNTRIIFIARECILKYEYMNIYRMIRVTLISGEI